MRSRHAKQRRWKAERDAVMRQLEQKNEEVTHLPVVTPLNFTHLPLAKADRWYR